MSFCNLLGYIWQSFCLGHVNGNGYANFYRSIPKGSRDRACFTFFLFFFFFFFFFRICTSAKLRPIPNVIWQSHWLNLVNINVYAKFHHNILHSSRDRAIFTFSEFGARQSLDRQKNVISQSLGLDLVYINVYAKVYQNIPLSSRDSAIFTFSEFGTRQRLDRW